MQMSPEQQARDLIFKALSVDGGGGQASIAPFIKEDLEDEAYVQLYSESDPQRLTLLKDLPRQEATQVNHEFSEINSYGNHKAKSSFSPNGLPPETNFEGDKNNVILKPYGKTSSVQGLTALQGSIRGAGQADIPSTNDALARLFLMNQINSAMFAEDTRGSTDNNLFKGIFQQIDEQTKGTGAERFANTDIFVDKRGQPLLPADLRSAGTGIGKRNGVLRRVYMAPEVLEQLEEQLDPAARVLLTGNMPNVDTSGLTLGQNVDGMRIQGEMVRFKREVALSTDVLTGFANEIPIQGAPLALAFAATPTAGQISQPAVTASGSSQFHSSNERLTGIVYIVTAVNEVGEAIASNISDPVDATATNNIEITINPRGDENSFRIYRGFVADANQPGSDRFPVVLEPQFIEEIPNGTLIGNTSPVTYVDDNRFLPGTSTAWGTDIWSPNAEAIDRGATPTSATNDYTAGRSAAALAQLTGLFEFDLAKLGWLHSNKLFAQVLGPMVPRPWVNVIFYNIGGKPLQKTLNNARGI